MDLKIDGLTPEIIKNALETTHKGRDYIIDEIILKAIDRPRDEVSEFAPKMISMQINPDKIREVIGTGGKVIQKIVADTGAKIDIEDDGSVFISAVDKNACYAAKAIIEGIVFEPVKGATYTGKVAEILPIGCRVEIVPGYLGFVHVRDLEYKRTENVEDVVKIGDEVTIKCLGTDEKGRVNFSRKAALPRRPFRPEREEGEKEDKPVDAGVDEDTAE